MTNWQQIRECYEENEKTVHDLCKRFGVSRSSLYRKARVEKWARRSKSAATSNHEDAVLHDKAIADRKELIDRLYRAFDRQMQEFEAHLVLTDDHGVSEKDARTLGSLARTLEKLIELRQEDQSLDEPSEPGVDIERLREELARRLERLCPKGATE